LAEFRKFEYRPSRLNAGFMVDFSVGGETFYGRCTDVSSEGIRAELEGAPPVEATGLLTLRHPIGVLESEARVAYVEDSSVGFAFLFQTPRERGITREFIAAIASYPGNSPAVRLL
jgi:hypothetical protein